MTKSVMENFKWNEGDKLKKATFVFNGIEGTVDFMSWRSVHERQYRLSLKLGYDQGPNYEQLDPVSVAVGTYESLIECEQALIRYRDRNKTDKPQRGDIIRLTKDLDYAFKEGGIARIETLDNRWGYKQVAHIVCGQGSAHHNIDNGYSISGGPFKMIDPSKLVDSGETFEATCWNWGRNGSGAHQGVYFKETVKVWLLNCAEVDHLKVDDDEWEKMCANGEV